MGLDIKLKLSIPGSSGLDVYVELPHSENFYYGVGVDAGFDTGGYLVGTYYFNDHTFITATGRIAHVADTDWSSVMYNPQLSFGVQSKHGTQYSLIGGYNFISGNGFDFNNCTTADDGNCGPSFVNHLIYGGILVTF